MKLEINEEQIKKKIYDSLELKGYRTIERKLDEFVRMRLNNSYERLLDSYKDLIEKSLNAYFLKIDLNLKKHIDPIIEKVIKEIIMNNLDLYNTIMKKAIGEK